LISLNLKYIFAIGRVFRLKIAVVGSRELNVEVGFFIPSDVSLIASGGARGIDSCAEHHARNNKIPFVVFKPDYKKFGRIAPIHRNKEIVNFVDLVIAIWDGESRGTFHAINYSRFIGKPVRVFTTDRIRGGFTMKEEMISYSQTRFEVFK
jgi:hypothetical protein